MPRELHLWAVRLRVEFPGRSYDHGVTHMVVTGAPDSAGMKTAVDLAAEFIKQTGDYHSEIEHSEGQVSFTPLSVEYRGMVVLPDNIGDPS